MRNPKLTIRRLVGLSLGLCAAALVGAVAAQNPDGTRVRSAAAGPAEPPHHRANEVGWRLAPSEQKYASIDGNRLKSYVGELTAMARRYRDNGQIPHWPVYDAATRATMIFDANTRVENDPRSAIRQYWSHNAQPEADD